MLQSFSSLLDVQETYRWFAQMRSSQPLWLDESSECWHVFRYEDVHRVTTDYSLFSSERKVRPTGRNEPQGRSILMMDPPDHRQYRNLVSSAFTPRALARLSHRITDITQELLDEVRPLGRMDVVTDIAYPLPTIVIAEMLGVPTTDRPLFKRWADVLLSQQLTDAEFVKPDEHANEHSEDRRR